jgi:hypothetical protein
VKCQLDLEGLVEAQQQLNGGGGGSGMGRMISNTVRNTMISGALTSAVRFVVGETANPSQEMMQHAIMMRSAPRTQAERDVYLGMMKRLARRTPEVVQKYTKTEVHKNGTRSHTVDFIALDADVTRRSLMYQQMRAARSRLREQERQQERQVQLEMERLNMLREMRMNSVNNGLFGAGLGTTSMFSGFGTTMPNVQFNSLDGLWPQTTPFPSYTVNSGQALGQQTNLFK